MEETYFLVFGAKITISNIIDLLQTLALIITIFVMWRTSEKQATFMKNQVTELGKTARLSAHNDVFAKILDLYKVYMSNTDVAKSMWPDMKNDDDVHVKSQFVFLYIMDVLHHIFINQESLNNEISEHAWSDWVRVVKSNPELNSKYEKSKHQYPNSLVEAMDAVTII